MVMEYPLVILLKRDVIFYFTRYPLHPTPTPREGGTNKNIL